METVRQDNRVRYFDLIRCIAFLFIIFYHMIVQLHFEGIYPLESVMPLYQNANTHIATLGVAMFFILSGACQVCSVSNKLDPRQFYRKKVFRILVPFYITYIGCFLLKAAFQKTTMYPDGVPKWRIIFTVLGLDEWLNLHGVKTYSLGIGEWFLGCILIIYLAFPVLYYLMKKNAAVFFAAATILYLLVLYKFHFYVAAYTNLFVKGYEFILGMLIAEKFRKGFPKWLALISVPVVIVYAVGKPVLSLNEGLQVTIIALAFWITVSYLEPLLRKCRLRILDLVSGYSYEMFLVHHAIIFALTPVSVPYLRGRIGVFLFLVMELLVIAAAAWIVKTLSGKVEQIFYNKKNKRGVHEEK